MKKVSIRIDEKTYEKKEPTLKDWFDYQEYSVSISKKNIIMDKVAADATVKVVADHLGITKEDILKSDISLDELICAYKNIQANILECFIKQPVQSGVKEEKK